MKRRAFELTCGVLLVGSIGACGVEKEVAPSESEVSNRSNQPSGETIVRWNENALTVLVAPAPAPAPTPATVLTRRLAIVHLAMHDAANAVRDHYGTYALAPLEDSGANPALAAAVAAHDALVAFVSDRKAELDVMLEADLAAEDHTKARERSVAIGGTAAQTILALRANDGSTAVVTYTPGSGPGKYQLTAPTVLNPNWQFVTPFGIASPDAYRPEPPYALDSAEYAADFNETKTLGRFDSSVRTADQTHAAKFWVENPPINFNRAAQRLATAQGLDLWDTARTFAVAQVAFADAIISVWNTKFFYDFWRPITAIRAADTDGNDATKIDPEWAPLNTTPPHPEYSAAHAVVAAAAAVVLDNAFGHAGFTMTTSTAVPAGSTRTFADFADAALDGANSRIYGGFHFRHSTDGGLVTGALIGQYVDANLLQHH